MTVKSALRQAVQELKGSATGTPELDAEVLLSHVTGLDRAGLYRHCDLLLAEEEESRFFSLVGRRLLSEPVAYLTGHKEFMGLDFAVNPFVLIPRPETELLVEEALRLLPTTPVIIDVGTGSGAIAISLAVFAPGALVYASDLSEKALEVARRNAERHGVAGKVHFLQGDLMDQMVGLAPAGGVDLITANLPYIDEVDLPGLPREVSMFEPLMALDGGAGGLDLYRRLIPAASVFLKAGGFLLLEIGCDQGKDITALLDPTGWETIILKDLAGFDRVVAARFGGYS